MNRTDNPIDEIQLRRVEQKLDFLLAAIVVQQKDACEMVGISPDTVKKKRERNEVEVLQADGSRLVYLTLQQTIALKPRSKAAGAVKKGIGDEDLIELFFNVQYKEINFRQFKRRLLNFLEL